MERLDEHGAQRAAEPADTVVFGGNRALERKGISRSVPCVTRDRSEETRGTVVRRSVGVYRALHGRRAHVRGVHQAAQRALKPTPDTSRCTTSNFARIGVITLAFQVTSSLLQPLL